MKKRTQQGRMRWVLAAAASLLLSACQPEQEVKVLRLAHTLDQEHVVHKAMALMGERLAEYSGGSMRIEIYSGGQLGNERELVELLQIGSLAMTKVSASPLEGFVPAMQVFSVPYIFDDNAHFWRVLESEIGQGLLQEIQVARLYGLGYYDAGSRSFYSSNTRIDSPADLRGKKFRVLNSQTAVRMVEALGGAATPIDWGELYTAIQQGVVDGAENNPPSFYLSRHYELSKYFSLDEHTAVPDVLIMSLHVWQDLTPEQQQWVQQAANDSIVYQRAAWQQASEEALNAVKAAGVTVIYPDKEPFRQAVAPFYQQMLQTRIGPLLQQIAAMREVSPEVKDD
ncbi:TRAP transporter solute receptor, DctP family protein [Alishewanella aestuarii B11]|uniref:TRAP transporter solute receptor, DctP family protein n=1 Tax=Alishewanella aestuarii B11 TaxID=1197174 RepID=J2IE02_9ALTE|nr:TRAP transporter substrate-binding protein [Alishewanella aestuarii]EJI84909.1 TRAP transporter solute receptor, DctP family protein [Alishewanella aestuarii B11]